MIPTECPFCKSKRIVTTIKHILPKTPKQSVVTITCKDCGKKTKLLYW